VATCLRWGLYFSMGFVANFIRFPAALKFRISVWQSYKEFKGGNFLRHSVVVVVEVSSLGHAQAVFIVTTCYLNVSVKTSSPLPDCRVNHFLVNFFPCRHNALTSCWGHSCCPRGLGLVRWVRGLGHKVLDNKTGWGYNYKVQAAQWQFFFEQIVCGIIVMLCVTNVHLSMLSAKTGEGMKMEKIPWDVGRGWDCCWGIGWVWGKGHPRHIWCC